MDNGGYSPKQYQGELVIKYYLTKKCSNFYRHLLKTGEIVDSNYSIDENGESILIIGELHYLFGKKEGGVGQIRVHTNKGIPKELRVKKDKEPKECKKEPKPKKRKLLKNADTENWDEDYSGNFSNGSKASTRFEDINPLPEFIDPITLEQVKRPAISPYGHVMGYDTWVRCLLGDKKNVCPFTNLQLSKRELIVLTIDNIDQYRYSFTKSGIK